MKIYVGHSKGFDYQAELYEPLRDSGLANRHEFIFPHQSSQELFDSKEELKKVDYMIAEISLPSIGLGIEIGWANLYNVPIIAICKTGSKVSGSVKSIAQNIVEYNSSQELIDNLESLLK
jgi:hypothetical protein